MYRLTMRKLPLFTLVLLITALCTSSVGQTSGPTLDLQLAPTLELAQVVYTSDFDFYQQGATTYLFQITLIGGDSPVEGFLVVEILQDDNILAQAQTTQFTLSAGEPISASNIELSNGVITQSGDEITLDRGETFAPTDQFENEVLSGGKLPRGAYQFIGYFVYNNGQKSFAQPLRLDILNPTFIRPIAPGYRAGGGSYDIVYSQFPMFQFESDFDPAVAMEPPFHVQIYKKLDQHQSIDELLTSTPHYDEWMYETVFAYPPGGVVPLNPGVYAWRIQLRYITTSGSETLESPVYSFRVEDPANMSMYGDESLKEDIIRFFLDLSEDKDKGREIIEMLSDYNLVAIRLNGQEITKQKFYQILDDYDTEFRKLTELMLTPTQ